MDIIGQRAVRVKAGHTPGPWVWRAKSGSLHQVGDAPAQFGQFGKCVLTPIYEYDSGADTIVSDADAALIAAAPDLLAALKDLHEAVQGGGYPHAAMTEARAAIAKAEAAP